MKKTLPLCLALLAAVLPLTAAPLPIYVNEANVTFTDANPPIDATAFVNLSGYGVTFTTTNLYKSFHEITSLKYFTNYGEMTAFPGFRITYRTNGPGAPTALANLENYGRIQASRDLFLFATNLLNPGWLSVGDQGYVQIQGNPTAGLVNLAGSGIQAGSNPFLEGTHHGRNMAGGRYTNDVGISDLYWGTGVNNRLAGATTISPMLLADYFGAHPLGLDTNSYPVAPSHQTIQVTGQFTATSNNFVTLPYCGGTNFAAYPLVSILGVGGAGSVTSVVQVVYVNTNALFTNLEVNVSFVTSNQFQPGWTSVVQFALHDTSIVDGQPTTNYLYLLDSTVTAFTGTNPVPYYINQLAQTTRRPANFELIKSPDLAAPSTPVEWLVGTAVAPSVDPFTNNAFYYFPLQPVPSTHPNVNVRYSGYSAWLSQTNFPWSTSPVSPSNYPGKVEITGNALDLAGTRIRAENYVGIETKNLVGAPEAQLPQMDAPYVNIDIGRTQGTLVISNAFPPAATVARFYGQLSAYSATWDMTTTNILPPLVGTNYVTNYYVTKYHVTVVDNCLGAQPVKLNNFRVHGSQLDILDPLNITGNMLLDGTSITVAPNGELNLPPNWSWGFTNVPRCRSLTNWGVITVPKDANFWLTNTIITTSNWIVGNVTNVIPIATNLVEEPYENVVNHGSIQATKVDIRSEYLENTSTPFITAAMLASNGTLNATIWDAWLQGGSLLANGKLSLYASNLQVAGTLLWAGTNNANGGALEIAVTNRLDDGGPGANNEWHAYRQGFQVVRRPASGDLLGTRLYSTLAPFQPFADHVWPARNLGSSTNGFTNNLALGVLVLDSPQTNSQFRFRGLDTTNPYALYVDYLDLRNGAQTAWRSILNVATNFTIYFANASVPPKKLHDAYAGRVQWVYSYAGARSSTNLTYGRCSPYTGLCTTNTYTFNVALVQSDTLDSDWDFSFNIDDAMPLFTDSEVDLVWQRDTNVIPNQIILTWTALAYATNHVLYTTNGGTVPDQSLTNFVNGPLTQRVSLTNEATTPDRFFRVAESPRDYLSAPPYKRLIKPAGR